MKFKVFFNDHNSKTKFSDSEILHDHQINKAMEDVKERQSHYCSHL